LNDEDAELLYNLGIKIGQQSKPNSRREEMMMYQKCVQVDPDYGAAWLNLGTVLAEGGNIDDAELMFLKALHSSKPIEVKPKAMVNLALIYHNKVTTAFQIQDIGSAKTAAIQAANYLDDAKPMLKDLIFGSGGGGDGSTMQQYVKQWETLRLACHRDLGQIYAGTGRMDLCEEEFRKAVAAFPAEIKAYQMLGRALEIQGKTSEMEQIIMKIQELQQTTMRQ
jgi:tetratricopeptide (TPR) repeat protein